MATSDSLTRIYCHSAESHVKYTHRLLLDNILLLSIKVDMIICNKDIFCLKMCFICIHLHFDGFSFCKFLFPWQWSIYVQFSLFQIPLLQTVSHIKAGIPLHSMSISFQF